MVATQLNFRLDGRVAVITGASSGIGASIATALASAGASVIAVGRERARLAELIQNIRSKGHTAESVVAELTTPDGVHGVVEGPSKNLAELTCWCTQREFSLRRHLMPPRLPIWTGIGTSTSARHSCCLKPHCRT